MDVVLISPVCPFNPHDGHTLAVLSDVNAVLDNGLTLGVIAFTYDDCEVLYSSACPSRLIRARAGGGASRFLFGVLRGMAPSLERLYTPDAAAQIREALIKWMPSVVIIDDASVAGYVSLVREIVPNARVILRSHNVMHDVRSEQLAAASGPSRFAVQLDCQRYLAFERQAVENCDEHWSITQADADRMVELYGKPCRLLSVSLPLDRYTDLALASGQPNRFVHVGTIDFRRRSDLASFLRLNWPQILEADGSATLTVAGKVYGETIPARNVEYLGRVNRDTDVYQEGRFALNFQNSTGGLKLKTLTSMAAGRVLISTPHGVEGLPVVSGRHYWDMSALRSRSSLNSILIGNDSAKAIAEAGREYVVTRHSRPAIARQFQTLLNHNVNAASCAAS